MLRLRSLVAEITDQQEKIEQQIKDAKLDIEKINELINEASSKPYETKSDVEK